MENLPQLRQRMSAVTDNYLNVQQDILETFIDRGQLRKLAEPTVMPTGKRVPGLKLDHPRLLAVMHALVRFANIAAGNHVHHRRTISTYSRRPRLQPGRIQPLVLRYDLSKLRAKHLVEKIASLPTLPPVVTGLFHLSRLSQAV